MAKIKSFPNNQDEYIGAEDVMRWLHGRTSGVFGANGKASVAPVLDSMGVTVSDGNGWIANDDGNGVVWWIDNEANAGEKLTLAIDMADGVLGRIDRVVVSWETTNYVALPEVSILKGTPSSLPTPPALTNNNTMRQISLARIAVPAGTVAITSNMITDERLDPSVCGIVTAGVGVDTSVMQAQFEAMLAYMEGRTIVPIPSASEAGKAVIVNPNGNGYALEEIQTNIPVTSNPGAEVDIWIDPDEENATATLDQIGAAPAGLVLENKYVSTDGEMTAFILEKFTNLANFTCGHFMVRNAPLFGSNALVRIVKTTYNAGIVEATVKKSEGYVLKYRNTITDSSLDDWSMVNPPMIAGTEYRTAERWNGKPVYTKLIDCGNMPVAGSVKEVPLGVSGLDRILYAHGSMSTGDCLPYINYASSVGNPNSQINLSCTIYNVKIATVAWGAGNDVTSFTALVQIKYTKKEDS